MGEGIYFVEREPTVETVGYCQSLLRNFSRFGCVREKFSPVPHLAAGGGADFCDDIQRGRNLLARQPLAAKGYNVFAGDRVAGTQLHVGMNRFAHLRMRPGGNARTDRKS